MGTGREECTLKRPLEGLHTSNRKTIKQSQETMTTTRKWSYLFLQERQVSRLTLCSSAPQAYSTPPPGESSRGFPLVGRSGQENDATHQKRHPPDGRSRWRHPGHKDPECNDNTQRRSAAHPGRPTKRRRPDGSSRQRHPDQRKPKPTTNTHTRAKRREGRASRDGRCL